MATHLQPDDVTDDIRYSGEMAVAFTTMSNDDMSNVVSVLHEWLRQVRKDGRIRVSLGGKTEVVPVGKEVLFTFYNVHGIAEWYVSASVKRDSWFQKETRGRLRREYLYVQEFARDQTW